MVKKVLNQREIDAILGMARGQVVERSNPVPRTVEPCNFAGTGQMSTSLPAS